MAKTKAKRKYPISIPIAIFLMQGQDTLYSDQEIIEINSQAIKYEDLLDYYQNFLEKYKIRYETEMYTLGNPETLQYIKIQPNFQITVDELLENVGTLLIIVKSRLLEYKQELEEKLDLMRTEILEIKEMIQLLKPIKENMDFIRKNSLQLPNLMAQTQSFQEKDINEVQLDLGILFSQPLYDDEKKKPTLPAVDFRSEISRLHLAL